LLLLALVAGYGWESLHYSASLKVDIIGPGFFPEVLAVLGSVLGILLFFGASPNETGGGSSARIRSDLVAMVPAVLLLGYIFATDVVGFPAATLCFLVAAFKYFGYASWKRAVILSAIITAVSFCLFYLVLEVKLPLGVFAGII